jgi:hypothetical protein
MANPLATSMTKSPEQFEAVKAFATLRFVGNRLDPDQLSQILNIQPTKSSKRTDNSPGIWYLATDKLIPGNDLIHHITFLISLLFPTPGIVDRLIILRDIVKRKELMVHLTCFWHGRHGAKKPTIPKVYSELLDLIPATIENDFDIERNVVDHLVRLRCQ